MNEKFKNILDQVNKDILNDETKKAITEAFQLAVDEAAVERAKLEVQNSLQKIDEDHGNKLTKILAKIDEDHTEKLNSVVIAINENHGEKLKNIVKHYETLLKEEALKFKDQMVSEVSNFMELYIDKTIPKDQIAEAANNIKYKKQLDKVKQLLVVDDEYVTESVAKAVGNGKQIIEDLRKQVNEALKDNIKLNQDLKKSNAALILEKKTVGLSDNKKNYVVRLLSDKTSQEIESNFNYVVEMFERDETDERIKESAEIKPKSNNADTPKSVITEEVVDSSNTKSDEEVGVSGYLAEMSKFDNKFANKK